MYTPRAFAETDLVSLDALVARDPFVSLVTLGADGLPFVSHLPVLYRRNGDHLLAIKWDQKPPGPRLPADVIARTQAKYLAALKNLLD